FLLARTNHGQANAITGNRCAVDNGCTLETAQDLDAVQSLGTRTHRRDFADVGDQSGEHEIAPLFLGKIHGRLKNSIVSAPAASAPERTSSAVIDFKSSPASASMPSGPITFGERNKTASSTRSALTNVAATVGPPSTIKRVIPRSASVFR